MKTKILTLTGVLIDMTELPHRNLLMLECYKIIERLTSHCSVDSTHGDDSTHQTRYIGPMMD